MSNKEIELEGKILLNALEAQRSKIAESMTELDQKLKKLDDTNFMLQSTPKKFANQLEETIPKIIEALKAEVLEQVKLVKTSNTEELVQHAEFLRNMEYKLREYSDNVLRIETKRVKMFFLGLMLSILISLGASIYGASYMIKSFPTRVVIDNPENIILYDSKVSLWGLQKTRVLDELRKKSEKKDSRKN
jgi:hypothetical protein